MRQFVILCSLLLAAAVVSAREEPEEIETIEIIEVVEDAREVAPEILGVPKYRWLSISGPVIWCLMVLAMATRWIKIKGRARQLLKWHKGFAYSAFCVATVHGIIGLFFLVTGRGANPGLALPNILSLFAYGLSPFPIEAGKAGIDLNENIHRRFPCLIAGSF